MRRTLLLTVALCAVAASPAAAVPSGGASYVEPTSGGAQYGAPAQRVDARPVAALLAVSPTTLRAGRMPVVRYRIVQRGTGAVDVRVAIVPLGRREAAVNARLGQQATGEEHTVAWPRRARLRPGRYTLRLHATDAAGNTLTRRAHQSGKAVITVAGPQRTAKEPKDKPEPPAAAPAPAPTPVVNPAGTFPVAGPHTFGGEDADFGSARDGHVHQGQDVTASEGTPVLAPTAGTIIAVDYQRGGAGYYVAMASADGRDFFFAHLQKGSTAVTLGQAVAAGTPLGRVGSTGSSTGPHLHFEIWEDGWQRGHPVDPLAQLRAWDR